MGGLFNRFGAAFSVLVLIASFQVWSSLHTSSLQHRWLSAAARGEIEAGGHTPSFTLQQLQQQDTVPAHVATPQHDTSNGWHSSGGSSLEWEGALSSRATLARKPVYIAICLVVKDEHASIREWVAYHISIGTGRMYVYDDGSQPPMQDILSDFIEKGLVVYHLLAGPAEEQQQMAIYSKCITMHRHESTWLGVLDIDEYVIVMDGSPSLPAVLRRYEAYGGLVVNWRIFGSSGHAIRPTTGVLQGYTKCTRLEYPPNTHVKSFMNTAHVAGMGWSPHHADYHAGFYAVNTNFSRVDGPLSSPPLSDELVINHYILRSAEEFQRKINNGNPKFPGHTKTKEFWDRTERSSRRDCLYAVPLGARVQAELAALGAARGVVPADI